MTIANTIYRYRVQAIDNSSSHVQYSNSLIINTSRGILTTPREVNLQGFVTSNSVSLTWTTSDDGGLPVLYYFVYRTTDSGLAKGLFFNMPTQQKHHLWMTDYLQEGISTIKWSQLMNWVEDLELSSHPSILQKLMMSQIQVAVQFPHGLYFQVSQQWL